MKHCLVFIFTTTWALASIINVPTDSSTIQAAINGASDGDTVLVQPGTYVENINFDGKNIVVGSLFLTTGSTSYISQTVIDGDSSGSVVTFENGEDSTAVLSGFTITNGLAANGGGIYCNRSGPILENLTVAENQASNGGGIWISDQGYPVTITNLKIIDNTASITGGGMNISNVNAYMSNTTIRNNHAYNGGGISYYSPEWGYLGAPSLRFVSVVGNSAIIGGGIYGHINSITFNTTERCNIYSNSAETGYDLYMTKHSLYELGQRYFVASVPLDTFTVQDPTNEYAYPSQYFQFDILHGIIDQQFMDRYVAPYGDDANSGTLPEFPKRTITAALTVIGDATAEHPLTIYVANGTYSPTQTGEQFPLVLKQFISLVGVSMDSVILDAEGTGRVITIDGQYLIHIYGVSVSKMIVTNGSAEKGGGISLNWARNINLDSLIIINNTASYGGGIRTYNATGNMSYLTVVQNTDGGIYMQSSSFTIDHMTISDNSSGNTGGINLHGGHLTLSNSICYNNTGYELASHVDWSDPWGGVIGQFKVLYSDIEDSLLNTYHDLDSWFSWLDGNIYSDPLFCLPDSGDYRLAANSPAVGSGQNGSNMGALGIGCDSVLVLSDYPSIPTTFMLHPNYPNPFNPVTTLRFDLSSATDVVLVVYDILGREVIQLIHEPREPGYHKIVWNGKDKLHKEVPSGIYIARLLIPPTAGVTPEYTRSIKMLLLK